MSELADLLVPFDLDLTIDDEVRYVRTVDRPSASVTPDVEPTGGKVGAPRVDDVKHSTAKNAFEEMMKKASSSKGPAASAAQRSKAAKPASGSSKQASIDVDDFDDDFLSTISKSDLDIIEKRARLSTGLPSAPLSSLPQSQNTYRPPQPSGNISLNAVPKRVVARRVGGTGFKSEVMRNLRFEHRQQITERKRTEIGGIAPRLPAASALGTGLGAYQGERRKIQPVESSGSSASDTSADEENQGISALVRRQKSPKNLARILPVEHRRPIKILGSSIADVVRQREDRRASQHAIKHRLRPDLNPLYRYVLAWNPDHAGPMAPHPQKHAAELAALKPVPTTFASSKYYEQIMLPLYLQELWSQCIKQKPTSPPLSVEISTRTYEDDFLDIELTVQGNVPFDFYANESDVVTLRKPGARPVFAKVQGFRKKFKETGLKVRIMVVTDQKEFAGKSRWQLQKHLSLGQRIVTQILLTMRVD